MPQNNARDLVPQRATAPSPAQRVTRRATRRARPLTGRQAIAAVAIAAIALTLSTAATPAAASAPLDASADSAADRPAPDSPVEPAIDLEAILDERPPGATELIATVRDRDGRAEALVLNAEQFHSTADRDLFDLPPDLEALEWNQTWDLLMVPDPDRYQQWAMEQVGFESQWIHSSGSGITVAVIDSGIAAHPELQSRIVAGYDYVDGRPLSGANSIDLNGHGTHVAGIIAATAHNGIGIHGAAPGVSLMPLRVLSGETGARWSDIVDAIRFATDNGAHVINLSLGGRSTSAAVGAAIDDAVARGVVVVAAAGNSGLDPSPIYPAAYSSTIAVAALDRELNRASFSTTGDWVEVAAPGVSILSTGLGSRYDHRSGTSMAAPHVAALAAILRGAHGVASADDVRAAIARGARDLGSPGRDSLTGHGIIDPGRSFEFLRNLNSPSQAGPHDGAGRILDTRRSSALFGGTTTRVAVPTPAGRSASGGVAILNVTAVHPSAAGYVTVWNCSGSPATSSLNFARDETRANLVVTGIDQDGSICVHTSVMTDLIIDSVGDIGFGSDFRSIGPVRVLDTRSGQRLSAGTRREVDLSGLLQAGESTAVLNVTAVHPDAAGYLSVAPCSAGHSTSTVNFAAGQTVAAGTIIGVDAAKVCVYTSSGTDVLIDIAGALGPSTAGHPPLRRLDTRSTGYKVAAGQTLMIPVTAGTGLAPTEVVTATVTAVHPDAAGFVTVWNCVGEPATSSLNYPPGATVANAVVSAVSATEELCVRSSASTHLLVDITGRSAPRDG